jgi:hypothetical protein
MRLYELERAYARALETGSVIGPIEFGDRVLALKVRGLDQSVAADLWEAGNLGLLRQFEAATDAEIAAINAAASSP